MWQKIKLILKSVRQYKKYALITPIFMILEAALECLLPFIMSVLIDDIGKISTPSDIMNKVFTNFAFPVTLFWIFMILIGFAIDVSIRAFKLLLLQMIAPVPVMSYIDPKSSKDGAFASWLKSLSSTFIEIFLKLGVIYLLYIWYLCSI